MTTINPIRIRLITTAFSLALLISFPVTTSAKDDKPHKGFESAEDAYKSKSKEFKKLASDPATDPERAVQYKQLADNYEKMAAIKGNAAKAAKKNKGGEFSWDEYHALAEKNQKIEQEILGKKKSELKKKSESDSKEHAEKKQDYSQNDEIESLKKQLKELEAKIEAAEKRKE